MTVGMHDYEIRSQNLKLQFEAVQVNNQATSLLALTHKKSRAPTVARGEFGCAQPARTIVTLGSDIGAGFIQAGLPPTTSSRWKSS